MRMDRPPTVPELEPAFRAYNGEALHPFLDAALVRPEIVTECIERAVALGDGEGTRLARRLLRLSPCQRQALRRALGAPGLRRLRQRP